MIEIADVCGTCYGSRMAVEKTMELLDSHPVGRVVLYKELLHNPDVMMSLAEAGAIRADGIDELRSGDTVVIRAHGEGKATFDYLAAHGIGCVDATCPNVTRIHEYVGEAAENGASVVVIGKKSHPEVTGILGWIGEGAPASAVVETEDDIAALPDEMAEEILLVSQTTFGSEKALLMREAFERKFGGTHRITFRNTTCAAQKNINRSSVELAKRCDVMFVIGGRNSSNTRELYESCRAVTEAYHVDSLAEFSALLGRLPLDEEKRYGLTGGASTMGKEIEAAAHLLRFMLFVGANRPRLSDKICALNERLAADGDGVPGEMHRYFAEMNEGGKLIRALLVNLGYSFCKPDVPYSDEAAMSYELFQTAILIHDDIIDRAKTRRGKPTIPVRWRTAFDKTDDEAEAAHTADGLALCAGDWGLYQANRLLLTAYRGDEHAADLMTSFYDTVIHTIDGEMTDVALPFYARCGRAINGLEEQILSIYTQKTAWYTVTGPIAAGMMLGGAKPEEIEAVRAVTEKLGIAFQIKDDLIGIYGDTSIGKDVGSDVLEFKQTFLYAKLAKTDPAGTARFRELASRDSLTEAELDEVRGLFEACGAKAFAEAWMKALFTEARALLPTLTFLTEESRALLDGLAGYLELRNK